MTVALTGGGGGGITTRVVTVFGMTTGWGDT